jgi:hypothetical protein
MVFHNPIGNCFGKTCTMKKTTTWAVFGSLAINLVLGCIVALVFSVAPVAQAAELPQSAPSAPATPAPAPPKDDSKKDSYLTAVRMGWAAG